MEYFLIALVFAFAVFVIQKCVTQRIENGQNKTDMNEEFDEFLKETGYSKGE